jgi:hypothetical protein
MARAKVLHPTFCRPDVLFACLLANQYIDLLHGFAHFLQQGIVIGRGALHPGEKALSPTDDHFTRVVR